MSLRLYLREEQEFLIFIKTEEGVWVKYDPAIHGDPDTIRRNYVVAYPNGEIVDGDAHPRNLPPGVSYIQVAPPKRKPERMPGCKKDLRVLIRHQTSLYYTPGRYCTRIGNSGNIPFKVCRFAAFSKFRFWERYRLYTISNDWFSADQFKNWYNQRSEWIEPGCEVVDQDNFGFGKGYWVFEIEFSDTTRIFVKSQKPDVNSVIPIQRS